VFYTVKNYISFTP